jgi:hypothetical protein
MIHPLSIATKGRISIGSNAKRILTIATLGLLVITLEPIPTPNQGGGGKGKIQISSNNSVILQKLQEEDMEVLAIIKSFLAAQIRK